MKSKRNRKFTWLAGLPFLGGLLAGCSILGWSTAVVVGTTSVVGYSVYEGGASVVNGVGSIGRGGDSKRSETVVITGKVLKVECFGSVEEVWLAAASTLKQANFDNLTGDYDLLSGQLNAQGLNQNSVTLRFKNEEESRTLVWIWTGPDGDLKSSQKIFKLLREELDKRAETAKAAGTQAESKEVNQ